MKSPVTAPGRKELKKRPIQVTRIIDVRGKVLSELTFSNQRQRIPDPMSWVMISKIQKSQPYPF